MSWIDRILPNCCRGRIQKDLNNSQTRSLPNSFLLNNSDETDETLDVIKLHPVKNDRPVKILPNRKLFSKPDEEMAKEAAFESKRSSKASDSSVEMKLIYNNDNFLTLGQGTNNEESPNTTMKSIEEAEIVLGNCYLDQFSCSDCRNEAKGICYQCFGSRFCAECFRKTHENQDIILHKFCKYTHSKVIVSRTLSSIFRAKRSKIENL